jgi:hypothetical protein|eukprot:COSAG06_NODE_963_length_11306_cov_5.786919_5_plen_34_part_00
MQAAEELGLTEMATTLRNRSKTWRCDNGPLIHY